MTLTLTAILLPLNITTVLDHDPVFGFCDSDGHLELHHRVTVADSDIVSKICSHLHSCDRLTCLYYHHVLLVVAILTSSISVPGSTEIVILLFIFIEDKIPEKLPISGNFFQA